MLLVQVITYSFAATILQAGIKVKGKYQNNKFHLLASSFLEKKDIKLLDLVLLLTTLTRIIAKNIVIKGYNNQREGCQRRFICLCTNF